MVEGLSERQPRAGAALRYGLPTAVAISTVGGVDVAIQAWRHAIGPSARSLVAFNYVFVLVVVALLLAAGFLAARSNGRLRAGVWAGAVAVAPPSALLLLVSIVLATGRQLPLNETQIAGDVIAVLLFLVGGALAGAIVSLPGALVGRALYRGDHAAELAALAAERAARKAAQPAVQSRSAPKKKDGTSWLVVWLLIAAFAAVVLVPDFAAHWAYDEMSELQALTLAMGGLVAGVALLMFAGRLRRLGYVVEWLGVLCLCFAVALALGELLDLESSLISGAAALVYLLRTGDRFIGGALPRRPDPPERPPVVFCHDGQAIAIYPSRRKLAAHASFSGGVALTCAVLAVIFRGAGPVPFFALSAFAVMGLIGFIPDFARLVYRRPALIVNSAGITDQASAGIFGFGLIRWHEVAGVLNASNLRTGSLRELAIFPVSFQRLLARQPLLKRPILRFFSALGGGGIFISSIFLSQPPAEVAQRINEYVKSHAPPDFLESEDEDEDEEELETQISEMTREM